MSTKWITEETPEGWRVVNSENRKEALREPDNAFRVKYFATEPEAREFADMLNVSRV